LNEGRPLLFTEAGMLAQRANISHNFWKLPGSRLPANRYGANLNRVVVSNGHVGPLAYGTEFVEATVSGWVQKAIDRDGDAVLVESGHLLQSPRPPA
jgi:hypothetical protein